MMVSRVMPVRMEEVEGGVIIFPSMVHDKKVLARAFADRSIRRQRDTLGKTKSLGLSADQLAGQVITAGLGKGRYRVRGHSLPTGNTDINSHAPAPSAPR